MNTEIDDRFRQLVAELADTAPEPHDWSLVTARSAQASPGRSHRPLALAAAGALVVAGAGVAAVALLDDEAPAPQPTPEVAAGPSQPLGGGTAGRCVEQYDLDTLTNRAVAFDGSVSAIGADDDDPEDPYIEVTFDVEEWFAPDGPDTVVVDMLPPGLVTSVGTSEYEVGTRLLIAGESRYSGDPLDDPVAWLCGFSRTYDEPTADAWREAFAAEG